MKIDECKFKHTDRVGLHIMVFIILWLSCMKGCNLDPEITNYEIMKKLEVIEAKLK